MTIDKIKNKVKVLDNTCWEWQKSCNSAGYGQLTENKIYWLAHRYAYACTNKLDAKDVVRHKCHNTKCCNPDHLELGTHKDDWYDSEQTHLDASSKRRKTWSVKGVVYETIREASLETGLSQHSLVKYTVDGIFDIDAYLQGCKKARVTPKLVP